MRIDTTATLPQTQGVKHSSLQTARTRPRLFERLLFRVTGGDVRIANIAPSMTSLPPKTLLQFDCHTAQLVYARSLASCNPVTPVCFTRTESLLPVRGTGAVKTSWITSVAKSFSTAAQRVGQTGAVTARPCGKFVHRLQHSFCDPR